MAKTVQMNVRIEADLKHKTERVLEKLTLSTTQAVTKYCAVKPLASPHLRSVQV